MSTPKQTKRTESCYHRFMKARLAELKAEHPKLIHKEIFEMGSEDWERLRKVRKEKSFASPLMQEIVRTQLTLDPEFTLKSTERLEKAVDVVLPPTTN